jgi:hypothetical protein
MSLTSQLNDTSSQATKFFREHFPDTRNFGKVWRELVCDLPCCEPPPAQEKPEWSATGTALDYRIRLYLQPYPASETIAFKGAKRKFGSQMFELDVDNPDLDIDKILKDNANLGNYFKWLWEELSAMWDSLAKEYGGKREFKNNEVELRISAICLIFSYFDEIFRSRTTPDILFSASLKRWPAESFVKNVRQTTVDDICQLSKLFIQSSTKIIDSGTIVLNPVFSGSRDVGGADADLIIDACLWEVKTTIKPMSFKKWPYQLLGYNFLDYENEFKLKSVGIYLSRQQRWISWPLEDLIRILAGDTKISIDEWRARFRKSLKQIPAEAESSVLALSKLQKSIVRKKPVKARP